MRCRPSRTTGVLTALAAVLVLVGVAPPSTAASPTGGPHVARLSSAWLPYWDVEAGVAGVRAAADVLSTVSPFWYRAATCTAMLPNAGGPSPSVVADLSGRGLSVVPTISSSLLPHEAIGCFGDPVRRSAHVEQVVRIATTPGYAGIDLNYESLALTTDVGVAAQVRGAFTAFAQETCAALDAADRSCVVTVMPRTDDVATVWRGKLVPAVYDYAALGAAADLVRVMAYDEHAPNTAAGPVAGYPWVQAVAAYAGSRVPAAKVELGIPLYGRDWSRGSAVAVRSAEAPGIAARHGRAVQWDDVQRAPHFTYTSAGGTRHDVWFNDARAVAERLALVRAHGFRAAFWAAGQEDAATWQAVRDGSRVVFTDVYGSVHEPGALAVAAAGIASGYADGTFRLDGAVTRGQLSTVLTRALRLPDPGAPAMHTDVAGSAHAAGIAAVTAAGIAGGYPDGAFRPDAPVTRGQLASVLTRGYGLAATVSAPYSDPPGNVHEYAVAAVTQAGLMGGHADGTFRPDALVTRGQLSSVLVKALALPAR